MRAGKDGKPDHLYVFLQGGGDDHLGRLAQAGIDDLHAGIAQRARDHFDSAVMTVHPRLGDKDPYSAVGSHRENMIHQESTLCMAHDGMICANDCSLESRWMEWHELGVEGFYRGIPRHEPEMSLWRD